MKYVTLVTLLTHALISFFLHSLTKMSANNTTAIKVISSCVSLEAMFLAAAFYHDFGMVGDRFLLLQQVAQQKSATSLRVSSGLGYSHASVDGPETEIIISCRIRRIEAVLRVQQHGKVVALKRTSLVKIGCYYFLALSACGHFCWLQVVNAAVIPDPGIWIVGRCRPG